MWRVATVLAVLGGAGAVAMLVGREAPPPATGPRSTVPPAPITTPPPPTVAEPGRKATRWLALASGSVPELNQVSIEQDLGLAREVLGPGGRVLFAAGPSAPVVQVAGETRDPASLRYRLGELFAPRGGRDARYRAPQTTVDGAATLAEFSVALDDLLASDELNVVLYLGGHGDQGSERADNTVSLWGQSQLTVRQLSERFDAHPDGPMVRVVATTCFSGGFAEIAFAQADPRAGHAPGRRCGLFATTWDLEAAGCDPNPERASQENYGMHFLNALAGRDRDGRKLPVAELDTDGDGAISLLEAHARVRIASTTGDVPTTTSERWLRAMGPDAGPTKPVYMPEEDAVVSALRGQLQLGKQAVVPELLRTAEVAIETQVRRLDEARRAEDRTYRVAAAELLARWPILDDPWHPEWATQVEHDAAAIDAHLRGSEVYAHYTEARGAVDELTLQIADARRDAAPLERLARALENRQRAGFLRAQGGRSWAVYEALLACERSPP